MLLTFPIILASFCSCDAEKCSYRIYRSQNQAQRKSYPWKRAEGCYIMGTANNRTQLNPLDVQLYVAMPGHIAGERARERDRKRKRNTYIYIYIYIYEIYMKYIYIYIHTYIYIGLYIYNAKCICIGFPTALDLRSHFVKLPCVEENADNNLPGGWTQLQQFNQGI